MDEKLFDYKSYINKKINEIDDLDERRYAKDLLLKGFTSLFDLFEEKYSSLEKRVEEELEFEWSGYVIQNTVISKAQFDPIHETLFPVCREDLSKSSSFLTIYLAASDQNCADFEQSKTITACKKGSQEKVTFHITKSVRYREALANVYQLFRYNEIPWNTVHIGHLERFFDLIPVDDNQQELDADEQFEFDWGNFSAYVREDMLPVWNIRESSLKSSEYIMPCIDGAYYEHTFLVPEVGRGRYLVHANSDILQIRYESNRIILKSKQDTLKNVGIYQLCTAGSLEDQGVMKEYKLLTNHKKDSFSARYLNHTGIFLQTRAEVMRKIQELSEMYGVYPADFQIVDDKENHIIPVTLLRADMNYFIQDEVFPMEKRRRLVFFFPERGTGDYLYESHIRYLLTQLQFEYLEYNCIGVLV